MQNNRKMNEYARSEAYVTRLCARACIVVHTAQFSEIVSMFEFIKKVNKLKIYIRIAEMDKLSAKEKGNWRASERAVQDIASSW